MELLALAVLAAFGFGAAALVRTHQAAAAGDTSAVPPNADDGTRSDFSSRTQTGTGAGGFVQAPGQPSSLIPKEVTQAVAVATAAVPLVEGAAAALGIGSGAAAGGAAAAGTAAAAGGTAAAAGGAVAAEGAGIAGGAGSASSGVASIVAAPAATVVVTAAGVVVAAGVLAVTWFNMFDEGILGNTPKQPEPVRRQALESLTQRMWISPIGRELGDPPTITNADDQAQVDAALAYVRRGLGLLGNWADTEGLDRAQKAALSRIYQGAPFPLVTQDTGIGVSRYAL